MNLFEMKQNLYDIGQKVEEADKKISEAATSPKEGAAKLIKDLQSAREDYQARYDALKQQVEIAEEKQKAALQPVKKNATQTPEEKKQHAFAQLVRNTMAKESVGKDIYEALGDNDETGGNKFLPKTVSTNIITAPAEKNALRGLSTITQIPNLEVPRLSFTLDDDSFIEDGDTAKEIKAKGDTVQFTRNKFKVMVAMSETVLLGSDVQLNNYVNQELSNGVTVKERSVAFNPAPTKAAEKHMSFYDDSVGIKKVSGKDLYDAITSAVADLHESYRENATIVMSYKDYLSIIKTLSNGSSTLYGAQPQAVLGKPVVFTDAASKPIIGDFSYSQYNYDINTLYDQDKDVHTGINYFVVTAWMDHQIKLANAFRIADVASGNAGK
ncbi:phage major capsid protein [Lactobacillus hominis]|uniref:Phage major capsid protein n=1 Tax=Lactobacillus hominis DSM 23910 = CRBIP 24.179 TaxID=1423758 RepID=I7JUR5_9LACO|nr:phage major capsid protein [Lactobacillus hominis]KRM85828.1 putative Prophage L54a, major capsid protein [Lactobacillus hominis DSM 23910 = CRBIP 24.179]MCT3348940.1 phage major capsid protein [Lactobacillus hominis]CCI81631.1 Phage major capsid protein [Lactobacillus hominis DSM 23910 = CRBIP 24.179]